MTLQCCPAMLVAARFTMQEPARIAAAPFELACRRLADDERFRFGSEQAHLFTA